MMAEKLSLYELQMIIRDSLYISLPDMYWVTGEISEIKQNYAGHCYLELVEKQADDINLRARVRAVIWCKKFSFLKSFFESSTGESLREGLKILVKIKIEYHELYGLSLVICDIDPFYTAGELAVKRRMIISRLENEGVFTMNKGVCIPTVIQRIAVISSAKAAGYNDFIKHLDGNSYGYVYYTKLFESPMQGTDTEQGILKALDRVADLCHHFDVVAILRGGGSQADLSWFDNYNIAFHITQFPIHINNFRQFFFFFPFSKMQTKKQIGFRICHGVPGNCYSFLWFIKCISNLQKNANSSNILSIISKEFNSNDLGILKNDWTIKLSTSCNTKNCNYQILKYRLIVMT
jgi:exodeoxyribonuclease VII large subunit